MHQQAGDFIGPGVNTGPISIQGKADHGQLAGVIGIAVGSPPQTGNVELFYLYKSIGDDVAVIIKQKAARYTGPECGQRDNKQRQRQIEPKQKARGEHGLSLVLNGRNLGDDK